MVHVRFYWDYPQRRFVVPGIALGICIWGCGYYVKRMAQIQHYSALNNFVRCETIPNRLLTDGIYQYTRNPMTIGRIMMFFGGGVFLTTFYMQLFLIVQATVRTVLAFRWGIYFGGLPVLFATAVDVTNHVTYRIPCEEYCLELTFGQAYRDYCQRTPRWLFNLDWFNQSKDDSDSSLDLGSTVNSDEVKSMQTA